jgi:hypothetical protein
MPVHGGTEEMAIQDIVDRQDVAIGRFEGVIGGIGAGGGAARQGAAQQAPSSVRPSLEIQPL